MELTRRDALVALGAGGVATGGVAFADRGLLEGLSTRGAESGDAAVDSAVVETLAAVAEVLYPSEAEGHRPFVETYVLGRIDGRETYRKGLETAVAELDAIARDWYGEPYADLEPETRDRLLRELGAETAAPTPDGPLANRVRYYVVNDLLYAFYSSATGGRLVGIENPIGYPGGTESYRRGPDALDGVVTGAGEGDTDG